MKLPHATVAAFLLTPKTNAMVSKHKHFLRLPFYLALLVLATLAVLAYYPIDTTMWRNYATSFNFADTFCEFTRLNHLVREPLNTLTNVPYLFFGTVILSVTARDAYRKNRISKLYNNLLIRHPAYGYTLGIVLVLIFICSTFFHASLIALAQQLDMAGVNALALFPIAYSAHRIYNYYRFRQTYLTRRSLPALFLGIFSIATIILTLFKWQLNAMVVVPLLVALSGILIFLAEMLCPNVTNKRWLAVAFGSIFVGMFFYVLDDHKIACHEHSIFQPHAIWHVFAATGAFALYLYLRSENMRHKFMEYRLHL